MSMRTALPDSAIRQSRSIRTRSFTASAGEPLRDGFGDPYELPRWWAFVASAACFLFALAAIVAAVRLFREAGRDV
jgi:hypothetical protein